MRRKVIAVLSLAVIVAALVAAASASAGAKRQNASLTDIFLNKITKWNDPRIKKLNPKVALPALNITPIYRSDNSGTTFNFTDYLSRISGAWRSGSGHGVSVSWPTGIGAKGSSGVAAALSQTDGAIGYVDVAYSLKNHFTFAAVKNAAGSSSSPGCGASPRPRRA